MNAKKTISIILGCLILLSIAYGSGCYTGFRNAMAKYKNESIRIEELYKQSENTNRQLGIELEQAKRTSGFVKDGNGEAKNLISELEYIISEVEGNQ